MIWSSQLARDVDQLSIQAYGIPSSTLMEEAGRAVAQWAMELWKPGLHILVVAGPGNNGGDALVAARILSEAGFVPTVLDVRSEQARETPDRLLQRQRVENLGIPCLRYQSPEDFAAYTHSTMIIDGLLGLGLSQALRPGVFRECLTGLQHISARIVLAIDMPSGMLADGLKQEALLLATHTVTFGAPKLVHLAESSRSACGIVRVEAIAFDQQAVSECLQKFPADLSWDKDVLPVESPWKKLANDSHKYTRGHILVVGGSAGKLGAPLLSGLASLRAGVGWASVALLSRENRPALPRTLTYEELGDETGIDPLRLLSFLEDRKVKACVIGPGTMQNPLRPDILRALAVLQKKRGLFLVFDAGALRNWQILAQDICFDPKQTLLTPHAGEWKAIGTDHRDLDHLNDFNSAWDFCRKFGVSVFYKTATPFTLWVEDKPQFLINTDGSTRLAKAGSGDVLAGVAAALLCAGVPATLAGNQAQRTLARASMLASERLGREALGPEDLIEFLGPSL